jgi:phage terminase large subunit
VYAARAERLRRLRERPDTLAAVKHHYAENIADWAVTIDPRNALRRPPRDVLMPFVLFRKQSDWVRWVLDLARNRESGLTEKSRDCGVSWLAMCTAVSLCLIKRNLTVGFGSAKEDRIDRSGDPDCLFWNGRTFLKHLPPEFRGSWDESKHSAHMRHDLPGYQQRDCRRGRRLHRPRRTILGVVFENVGVMDSTRRWQSSHSAKMGTWSV